MSVHLDFTTIYIIQNSFKLQTKRKGQKISSADSILIMMTWVVNATEIYKDLNYFH